MFVRFVAACCMGMSVVSLSLYWAEFKFRHVPINPFLSALWVILFLVGTAILVKAKAIANWIADKLE